MATVLPVAALLVAQGAGAGPAGPEFSGGRALELIEEQVSMGPRVPGSRSHARAANWMEEFLRATAGGAVVRQEWRQPVGSDTVDAVNLAARFGPQRSGGLLLGAHWDSRPWADKDPDPAKRETGVPGANDGASGTAVLLTLAEVFSTHAPPIPVTLAFFDVEDVGDDSLGTDYALGSLWFVRNWPVERPDIGIVIDMICRDGQLYDWEEFSRQGAGEVHKLLTTAEAAAGLYLFSQAPGGPLIDDHVRLLAAGIPTALVIGIQDPDWHTLRDRPENCSSRRLQEIGTLICEIVYGGYLR